MTKQNSTFSITDKDILKQRNRILLIIRHGEGRGGGGENIFNTESHSSDHQTNFWGRGGEGVGGGGRCCGGEGLGC